MTVSYRVQNDIPDEIYVELGKLAASAGQIEFYLFGMVHDLLQSPLPGISVAKMVAGDLTFAQTANLVKKLIGATFGVDGHEAGRYKAWLKDASEFMQLRNSMLHASWMTTEDGPPIPVQRKGLKADLKFDIAELQQANVRADSVITGGWVVAAEIQGKIRSAKQSQPPA